MPTLLKDFYNKFIQDGSVVLLERISNPFLISLVISWTYSHRYNLNNLLFGNYEEKLWKFIELNFLTWSWPDFFSIISLTFLFMLSYTFFSLLAYTINSFSVKVLKPKLVMWFDKKGFVSASDHRKNLTALTESESKLVEIETKNRQLEDEKNSLNEELDDIKSSKPKSPDLIRHYQKVVYSIFSEAYASQDGITLQLPEDIEKVVKLLVKKYPHLGKEDAVREMMDDIMLDELIKETRSNVSVDETIKWTPKNKNL